MMWIKRERQREPLQRSGLGVKGCLRVRRKSQQELGSWS